MNYWVSCLRFYDHILPSGCRWVLRKALKKLDIDEYITINSKKYHRIGTHSFRRYFITEVSKNKGLIFAQKIIGHVKMETCLRYINNIEPEAEAQILDKLFQDITSMKCLVPQQTRLLEF